MKRPPRACARSGISGLKDQRIPGDDSVAKPKRNAIPRLESITRGEGRGKRERGRSFGAAPRKDSRMKSPRKLTPSSFFPFVSPFQIYLSVPISISISFFRRAIAFLSSLPLFSPFLCARVDGFATFFFSLSLFLFLPCILPSHTHRSVHVPFFLR